jgi:tetratricopeptide (TPR) repeat protein
VGQPFTVEAGDRFDLTGSLRRDGGPPFAEVNHKLKVLVEQAVLTLRLKDRTTPWKGRFEPEGDLLLRFTPPVTVSDKRLSKLLEGRRALDRNDNAAALGHFGELLKLDPGDEGARAGIGEAYLNLGRFSEAAREFEALLPSVRETKSSICFSLAYAYVALADQQKAESTLRLVVPADQISRVIENIREDLKKRRR